MTPPAPPRRSRSSSCSEWVQLPGPSCVLGLLLRLKEWEGGEERRRGEGGGEGVVLAWQANAGAALGQGTPGGAPMQGACWLAKELPIYSHSATPNPNPCPTLLPLAGTWGRWQAGGRPSCMGWRSWRRISRCAGILFGISNTLVARSVLPGTFITYNCTCKEPAPAPPLSPRTLSHPPTHPPLCSGHGGQHHALCGAVARPPGHHRPAGGAAL